MRKNGRHGSPVEDLRPWPEQSKAFFGSFAEPVVAGD
jgi:hypothetical protein